MVTPGPRRMLALAHGGGGKVQHVRQQQQLLRGRLAAAALAAAAGPLAATAAPGAARGEEQRPRWRWRGPLRMPSCLTLALHARGSGARGAFEPTKGRCETRAGGAARRGGQST